MVFRQDSTHNQRTTKQAHALLKDIINQYIIPVLLMQFPLKLSKWIVWSVDLIDLWKSAIVVACYQ